MSVKSKMKNIQTVLIEAIVVGACLVAFFKGVELLLPGIGFNMTVFASGVVFHLVFEYIGLNKWYSIEYCKLWSS